MHVSERAPGNHLETIHILLREKGLRVDMSRGARGTKDSTANVYQSRWKIFRDWCRQRGFHPFKATIPLVLSSFVHFYEVEEHSLSSVKGFWLAIKKPLFHLGFDLRDQMVVDLFTHFKQTVPHRQLKDPGRNLNLALHL